MPKLIIRFFQALVSVALFAVVGYFVVKTGSAFLDERIQEKRISARLDRLAPPFYYLADFVRGQGTFNEQKLEESLRYYTTIQDYYPDNGEASALAGFCQYHLGRTDEALANYHRAVMINPEFFWHHYNLGVIFIRRQDYEKAGHYFRQALAADPQKTMSTVTTSRIFLQVLAHLKGSDIDLVERLKKGYEESSKFLALSHLYTNRAPRNEALIERFIREQELSPKIF